VPDPFHSNTGFGLFESLSAKLCPIGRIEGFEFAVSHRHSTCIGLQLGSGFARTRRFFFIQHVSDKPVEVLFLDGICIGFNAEEILVGRFI